VDRRWLLSTVYRTVKLFLECGIAQEVRLADDTRRLRSPSTRNQHHDHLICVKCGRATEFFNCHLEMAQKQVTSAYGFKPDSPFAEDLRRVPGVPGSARIRPSPAQIRPRVLRVTGSPESEPRRSPSRDSDTVVIRVRNPKARLQPPRLPPAHRTRLAPGSRASPPASRKGLHSWPGGSALLT